MRIFSIFAAIDIPRKITSLKDFRTQHAAVWSPDQRRVKSKFDHTVFIKKPFIRNYIPVWRWSGAPHAGVSRGNDGFICLELPIRAKTQC
jgi:hypothetical protein